MMLVGRSRHQSSRQQLRRQLQLPPSLLLPQTLLRPKRRLRGSVHSLLPARHNLRRLSRSQAAVQSSRRSPYPRFTHNCNCPMGRLCRVVYSPTELPHSPHTQLRTPEHLCVVSLLCSSLAISSSFLTTTDIANPTCQSHTPHPQQHAPLAHPFHVPPGSQACNANKRELREGYASAKACAERVNASRDAAVRAKAAIERLRLSHVLAGVASGAAGNADAAAVAAAADAEAEAPLKSALDAHKCAYRSAFTELSEIKTRVEHIQALTEAGIACIRRDGEAWFARELALESKEVVDVFHAPLPQPEPLLPTLQQTRAAAYMPQPSMAGRTALGAAEDDIRAFYKAREELSRRRAAATAAAAATVT